MALPIIPLAGLGLCGFVVWRAFRERPSVKPSAENNWQNEGFSTFLETGTWAEGPNSTGSYHQNATMAGSGLGGGS